MDKELLKSVAKKSVKFLFEASLYAAAPLYLPTFDRKYEDGDFELDIDDMYVSIYNTTATLVGVAIDVMAATSAFMDKNPLYLIIPAIHAVPNALSGIYELYISEREKRAGLPKSASTHGTTTSPSPASASSSASSSSGLEEKVEKEEEKPPRRDISNPWDIDIPKIEDKKIQRRY